MDTDPYERFAERYDWFYESFADHEPGKSDFSRALFTRYQVQSVLDCACGTGRDLHLLQSLGFEVLGSDRSVAMLAQAERNLATHHVNVPLDLVDYRELHLHYAREFDAIVCLSSSIWEMPEHSGVIQAFASMRNVLRDGGILIVSSGISDMTWGQKPRFIPEVWKGDFLRLFVVDYIGDGARFNVIDLNGHPDGSRMESWSMTYNRVYLRDDIEEALVAARFRECRFYGDYLFEPYDRATSGMLIAVAQK